MSESLRPLSDVVRVHYGSALKEGDRVQTGTYDVFGSSGLVGKHDEALIERPTIIIGRKGSVGAITFAPKGGWAIDTAFYVELLEPHRHDLRFFYHALKAANLKQHTITTSIPGLSRDDIYRTRIRVPPLSEQRHIADILDRADAIRRKRKEAIALTEELLRSAFLEMFGDPIANPKGWAVKPLGEVIDKLEAGWSVNGDARSRRSDEYGVLKISAVTSGSFRPREHKAVSQDAVDRELVTPRKGDLLFSRANTRELVAATCLVEQDEPRLFLPDKIWRVIPRPKIAATPYVRFLLAHERFRGELTKTATGTSGSMLNVSMEKLRALRAPIPPFSTQERFANLVWKSLKARAMHERSQEATEELFSSLVHRAFRGELTGASGAGQPKLAVVDAGEK